MLKQAVHIKLKPSALDKPALETLKASLLKMPGEQAVNFHIQTIQGRMIIIRSAGIRVQLADADKGVLHSLPVVEDIQLLDASIEQYTLLKDVFQAAACANGHELIKITKDYLDIVDKAPLDMLIKRVLRTGSKIVRWENGVLTIALPNQHTLDLFRAEGRPGRLESELSRCLGQAVSIQTEIDPTLQASLDDMNQMIAAETPAPYNDAPSQAPKYEKQTQAKKPMSKPTPKKKIAVPQTPEEIFAKTLDIFSGIMNLSYLPKQKS